MQAPYRLISLHQGVLVVWMSSNLVVDASKLKFTRAAVPRGFRAAGAETHCGRSPKRYDSANDLELTRFLQLQFNL